VPARDKSIVVAVTAIDDPPPCDFRRKCKELHGFVVAEQIGARRCEHGLRKVRASARSHRLTIEDGRPADDTNPALARDRLVDDPDHWPPLFDERDQCPEDRSPRHEADSAVDWIEDPSPPGRAILYPIFFADNAVARIFSLDDPAHRGLCGAIGLGHRTRIGLRLGVELRAEKRTDRSTRCVGKSLGKFDVGRFHRSTRISRKGSRRSTHRRCA